MRSDPPSYDMTAASASPDLGEQDREYILLAQPVFEDLRQIVNLLAGFMLVSQAAPAHGFVAGDLTMRSRALLDEARQQFERLTPGPRSRHHFLHLQRAFARIEDALGASRESRIGLDPGDRGLADLSAAWREMIHVSNALPGFERVDLSQSCCAQHFATRKQPTLLICEGAPL
jgi:hypothetical protein